MSDTSSSTSKTAWFQTEHVERRRPAPYEVYNCGELITTLGSELTPRAAIDEVVKDYLTESYNGLDLVVFRNGYLIGTVLQGQDGQPIGSLTEFEW